MFQCPYLHCYRIFSNNYRQIHYKIIVDLDDKILYLYKNNILIETYPICIGKPSTPSPKGTFKIINKAINPGGPFGIRWLGLNAPFGDYGIHGTNNPSSIGKELSNGCIRLNNKDIFELSNIVPINTDVIIE